MFLRADGLAAMRKPIEHSDVRSESDKVAARGVRWDSARHGTYGTGFMFARGYPSGGCP